MNVYSVRLYDNKYILEINGRVHFLESNKLLYQTEKTLRMLGYRRLNFKL